MPSDLEKAKARKEALLQQAFVAHNSGVQEDKRLRLMARRELQGLIREQRGAHRRWQEEQQQAADEGGWFAGMMAGAGTGASIGTAIKPGWGTAIGGALGALGGGIYGALEGRQAVGEVAPYGAAVSQLASGYSQMEANKKQNQQLIDFYTKGKGEDEDQVPGMPSGEFPDLPRLQGSTLFGEETKAERPTSVEGGLSLGVPRELTYRERPLDETLGFDFDTSGESLTPEEAQMGYLDQQIQTGDWQSGNQYGWRGAGRGFPTPVSAGPRVQYNPAYLGGVSPSPSLYPRTPIISSVTGLDPRYTGLTQPYTRKLP